MKIESLLEYQLIPVNSSGPVHFAVRLQAPERETPRPRPAAFCVVLDQSGSMDGPPLEKAKEATVVTIRNLRKDDWFGLVIFDDMAKTVMPLQKVTDRQALIDAVRQVESGGSTNLTGGWMLGRDELKKAPAEASRRLLLLSDGHLNTGIVEPSQVRLIVGNGLEEDGIRTSCLGFGDHYNEDLLSSLALATNGQFYDADSPEQLPAIFQAELEGLQKLTAQNVRVRLGLLDFCDGCGALGNAPVVDLPDGRKEYAVGDLVSGEERVLCFALSILPVPTVNGQPVVSLEGEALLALEVVYDELREAEVASQVFTQTIRIQRTQDPGQVQANGRVISWVAGQKAGRAIQAATQFMDQGHVDMALKVLREAIAALGAHEQDTQVAQALHSLRTLEQLVASEGWAPGLRKLSHHEHYRLMKGSSRSHRSGRQASLDEWLKRQQQQQKPQDNQAPPPNSSASPPTGDEEKPGPTK